MWMRIYICECPCLYMWVHLCTCIHYILFFVQKKIYIYIYTYGSVDRIAYPKCEPHNTNLMGKEKPTISQ